MGRVDRFAALAVSDSAIHRRVTCGDWLTVRNRRAPAGARKAAVRYAYGDDSAISYGRSYQGILCASLKYSVGLGAQLLAAAGNPLRRG